MAFEKILVVDDEPIIRRSIAEHFQKRRYSVYQAETIRQAKELIASENFDFILLDERLPDGKGSDLLEYIRLNIPYQPFVVMISGYGSVEEAVQCIHKGAFDFVLKPFSLTQVEIALKRAESFDQLKQVNQFFNTQLNQSSDLIGNSSSMIALKKIIQKVATTAATVLVYGENGTGKELVAREIFRLSRLNKQPFIKVNCAAMSESLIESEFFGHEKGAFTGANERRTGRFELANGGTILLDEIGEISPKIQAKLLRVLQEKEFERVGGTKTIKVSTRVIATTNRNLEEGVEKGEFREDLFYRLSVFPMNVPPLRERGDDILLIANNFLKRFSHKHGIKGLSFTEDLKDTLLNHSWPGNVRELENAIERAVILAEENEPLSADFITFRSRAEKRVNRTPPAYQEDQPPPLKTSTSKESSPPQSPSQSPSTTIDSDQTEIEDNQAKRQTNQRSLSGGISSSLEELERQHILRILTEENGNRTAASERLKITTRTLRNKLHLYKEQGFSIPEVS